jgi:hypothetical protein
MFMAMELNEDDHKIEAPAERHTRRPRYLRPPRHAVYYWLFALTVGVVGLLLLLALLSYV